jgi:uncharacterized protein YbjT (DUF2867 family)
MTFVLSLNTIDMKKVNPSILITGATGTVGSEVVKQLLKDRVPVRILTRSAEKTSAFDLPGVEVHVGDLADSNSLSRALGGIETAFLLTNSSQNAERLQMNFVEAGLKSGMRHIVKLSQFGANTSSPVRFLRYHASVENAIVESGINYTFLRPNLFMQGFLRLSPLIRQGRFFAPIADARVSIVDVRDIAAVAARTLCEASHYNKAYSITGAKALSHNEIAATITHVTGHRVEFQEMPAQKMKNLLLSAGFPVWQADGLLEDYAHYNRGEAEEVTDAVQTVTGRHARSFDEFVSDHIETFVPGQV